MSLPKGWSPGDACPVCDSRVWDNRGNKRNPKAPDFKCSNAQCDNGGRPWAAWADPPQRQGGAAPAQRAAALAQGARVTLTPDQFWPAMTDALIQAKQALTTAGLPIEQAREVAAQFFILIEHGVVVLKGKADAPSTAQLEISVGAGEAAYMDKFELCGSIDQVDAVMAEIRRDVSDKVLLARLLGQGLKFKKQLASGEGVI